MLATSRTVYANITGTNRAHDLCSFAWIRSRPPLQLRRHGRTVFRAGALSRGRDVTESDPVFVAGITLKSLDDLIRADPPWLGTGAIASPSIGRRRRQNARPHRG